jgi:hypothetical protein
VAYLDVREDYAGAAGLVSPRVGALFERQEWEIIALAARDGLSSLHAPGRTARMLGWLFGSRPDRRLANDRLEALRRFAVLAWHHGYETPAEAMKTFLDEGFSRDQLALLLSSITTSATSRRARA